MNISNHYVNDYRRLVKHLFATLPLDRAVSAAVGGNFAAMGEIEKSLLVHYGLQPTHTLVDIGCGSGRLTGKMIPYLNGGKYIGIDVVPELVEYARQGTPENWEFIVIDHIGGLTPAPALADVVCFFSVFTHLLPEEAYTYLSLAVQALRPDGRIVFSFLEYDLHWNIFAEALQAVASNTAPAHLNTFFSRDQIAIWCERLGLKIVAIHRGDEAVIQLGEEVTFDDGIRSTNPASLGQSFAVLALA